MCALMYGQQGMPHFILLCVRTWYVQPDVLWYEDSGYLLNNIARRVHVEYHMNPSCLWGFLREYLDSSLTSVSGVLPAVVTAHRRGPAGIESHFFQYKCIELKSDHQRHIPLFPDDTNYIRTLPS